MEKIEIGEVFTISNENNEEEEVEVLAIMTIDDNNYVAVSYLEELNEENEEDIDVFFLKIENDGSFSVIESDDEFDAVSLAFDEQMELEEDLMTREDS